MSLTALSSGLCCLTDRVTLRLYAYRAPARRGDNEDKTPQNAALVAEQPTNVNISCSAHGKHDLLPAGFQADCVRLPDVTPTGTRRFNTLQRNISYVVISLVDKTAQVHSMVDGKTVNRNVLRCP